MHALKIESSFSKCSSVSPVKSIDLIEKCVVWVDVIDCPARPHCWVFDPCPICCFMYPSPVNEDKEPLKHIQMPWTRGRRQHLNGHGHT